MHMHMPCTCTWTPRALDQTAEDVKGGYIRASVANHVMSAVQAFSWCQDIRKMEAKIVRQIRAFGALEGKPLIEPSVPAAASRAAPPLRNRIDPMEEEGAVGQRSRRSPSPRRSPPAVEGVLVGDEGGDIESRPTHVTGGMGDERERCALRRRLRRARGRRSRGAPGGMHNRSTPRRLRRSSSQLR